MVNRLGMVIAGFPLLFYAWRLYTIPLASNAPERTADLYKYLGQEGQAAVAAGLGFFFVIFGAILVRNAIVSMQQPRAARIAEPNAARSRRA
jgi:hypothetical protein